MGVTCLVVASVNRFCVLRFTDTDTGSVMMPVTEYAAVNEAIQLDMP